MSDISLDIQRSIDLYNQTLREAAASRVVEPADLFRTDLITPEEQIYLDGMMGRGGVGLVIEVISAAHQQGNAELTKLGCQHIANLIKGRSPAEIRQTFAIDLDGGGCGL